MPFYLESLQSNIRQYHIMQVLKCKEKGRTHMFKRVKRTGWVLRNVPEPESVADHMYRMAALSFLVGPTGLDKERCIKLSLVHDMAESIVGDLTPEDRVAKTDKFAREEKAMKHITDLVGEDLGKELLTLWEEYENGLSPEAAFVKDLDKFEMIFQAYEYEQLAEKPGSLQEFFESTKGKFQVPQVQEWVKELEERRAKYEKEESKGT